MAFTDYSLIKLGSFIGGMSPTPPGYMTFGLGSSAFIAGNPHLGSEILRKSVSWSFVDNKIQGQASLLTTDAVGSNIQEIGLGTAVTPLGSDLWTRELSAIGLKNNTFDVDVKFDIEFRRA